MMASMPDADPPALRPRYPVTTKRLLIRPLTPADADGLLAYRSIPDVCRYVPFEPQTREELLERIATRWTRTELTAEGQVMILGVQVRDTGALAGDVMLAWQSREHACGEIGAVFNPDMSGRGYATEALDALLRLGFEGLGLHRIIARIDERNGPSVRLVGRLGMRLEGRLVENEWFKGEWTTELDFAMLAGEWQARPAPARGSE
jgi:RimJ/RimL family protein N-acetyltransferase